MWEERYGAKEYAYGKLPNDFLVESTGQIPVSGSRLARVLCLAQGEGRNAVYLAKQGFGVVAVDTSNAGMIKARKLAAENDVTIETIVADLAVFEAEAESYGAAVSIFCHVPTPLRQTLHAQVVKWLKPGGVFLLEAYTPDQLKFKSVGHRYLS